MGLIRILENIFLPDHHQHDKDLIRREQERQRYFEWQMAWMEWEHQRRLKSYEELLTPEHLQKVNKEIAGSTHADITPPWEE